MARRPRDLEQLGGALLLPRLETDPFRAIGLRVLVAVGLLLVMAVLVYADRDGYTDVDGAVSFLDALYYATVSASTTGFGEIAPVTPEARLVNVVVVTPLRVAFLAVLIGTTIEVATRAGRQRLRIARWQRGMSGHIVIVGFGTKGQAALARLLRDGVDRSQVVAVTGDADGVARAGRRGVVAVSGDGSRDSVLLAAVVDRAACVIVAVPTDAGAVLITLTARRLAPQARIVATARKGENAELLRASGADAVMVSADATGRQLALGLTAPVVGALYGQMLEPGRDVQLTERTVEPHEVGLTADELPDLVLAVTRDGVTVDVRGSAADARSDAGDHGDGHGVLEAGDLVVVLQGRQTLA